MLLGFNAELAKALDSKWRASNKVTLNNTSRRGEGGYALVELI